MKKRRILFLWVLPLIALIETVALQVRVRQAEQASVAAFQDHGRALLQKLELKLQNVEKIARELAAAPPGTLRETLRDRALVNPGIGTLGLCYAPFALDPGLRLHGPRFRREAMEVREEFLEDKVDYTLEGYRPYQASIGAKEGLWCEPHIDPVSLERVLQYSHPLPGSGKGYVYLQIHLNDLVRELDHLGATTSGYYILVSESGHILSHPLRELAKNLQPLKDHLKMEGFLPRGGVLEGQDPFFHRPIHLLEHHLRAQGIRLLCAQEKVQILLQQTPFRRSLYRIITEILAFVVATQAFKTLTSTARSKTSLWRASSIASGALIAGTGAVWALDYGAKMELGLDFDGNRIINSARELSDFKKEHIRSSLGARNSLPVFIPTGLFIQTVEFSNFSNVEVTGYVWQKYQDDLRQDISHGYIFPDAIGAKMEKAYERRQGDSTVVGWYFEIMLREQFDFQKFPFDTKKMKLRVWHKDFEKNIVLVPDLESYVLLNPHTLPGLEKSVFSEGWDFESAFFAFHPNAYNTNFGFENYEGQAEFPELNYFVVLKRNFIGPFISNFAPLLVIALILFSSVMGLVRAHGQLSLMGFTVSGNIGTIAALFFGIVYSHTSLRNSLPVKDVFYLEYFYFALYLLLMIVSLNAFMVAWCDENHRMIRHDNRLFKMAFWPSLWLPIFLATLYVFY